jgi:hypothetical protein
MRTIFILTALAVTVLIASSDSVQAQGQWYRGNVREIIRKLEANTDRFKRSLDNGLDRSNLNGTRREDQINEYVRQFEEATDRLRDRAEDQQYAPNLAREVLYRGRSINTFMRNNQLGGDAKSDWVRVRNDLTWLANSYYIRWRW